MNTATVRELTAHIIESGYYEEEMCGEVDDIKSTEHEVLCYFTEAGNLRIYLEQIADFVVTVNDDDYGASVVTWDPSRLKYVTAVGDLVFAEYNLLPRRIKGPNLWTSFYLSGDDDVDYCGGYLEIAADICRQYDKS
jgi:hypothetical protein